jgi:RNA polymerase sigma-70 factor, ECF subfamily
LTADFYNQYGSTLRAVADQQIAGEMKRRVGASDIVQSAFRTFFRRAEAGKFQFQDSEKLWSLMCAITLTKVREQVRFHRREKRDVHRESRPGDSTKSNESDGFELLSGEALSPEVAAEFADQFEKLMSSLDEEERRVLSLKIDDYTNEEIADSIGSSERTVRRIVKRLKTVLGEMYA